MKSKYLLLLPLLLFLLIPFISAGECSEFSSIETCEVVEGCSWESFDCSDVGWNFELCESPERIGCFYGGCDVFSNEGDCNSHIGCNWEEDGFGGFVCGGAGYCGGVYNETCVGTYTTSPLFLGVLGSKSFDTLTGQTIQEQEQEQEKQKIGFWSMFSNWFQNLFGRVRGLFK